MQDMENYKQDESACSTTLGKAKAIACLLQHL